ncbi:chymotrypsin 6-like protein [Leptotrombidium deliense]|uniref:Chymotrypsin 6-like protein n=1 Tax=Leptotrombidium deliense TaxID=299467 RepID=A0A443SP34_9ACAR|nr:chymotrypsin 6-like protein [Leptotrombidium deliense]
MNTQTALIFILITFKCYFSAEIPCGVRNINGTGYDRFVKGIATRNEFNYRVINGRNAYFGEVPWVVELQIRRGRSGQIEKAIPEEDSEKLCPSQKADFIRVCIGERNMADPNDGQTCYYSREYVAHEEYKCCSDNLFNDIAIIKIKEGMNVPRFTKNGLGSTNTLCLPNEDIETGPAYIAGWGRNNPNTGGIPKILQTAQVNVITLEQCKETFGEYVAEKQTCALGSRGESACSGDSGSAMFTENGNHVSTAVGVSSFAADMKCTGNPLAYAKVYSYLDFIKQNMG